MTDDLLASTADALFTDLCPPEAVDAAADADGWAPRVWDALAQAELTLLPVPEECGGAGAGLAEAAVVLHAAGRYAAPVPLAETGWLAGWLLSTSGLDVPTGPLSAAVGSGMTVQHTDDGLRVSGRLTRVPYGRCAASVALLLPGDRPAVALIEAADWRAEPGRNLADEPRDTLVLDSVTVPAERIAEPGPDVTVDAFTLRGALARSVQMAGAADRALELTVRYAGERVQFGRPIGRFQAVQQELAELAGEVSATGVAAEAAVRAVADGEPYAELRVAAAKQQAGRAAGIVTRLAHQVHGAIGFTREHVLRHSTTRLWAWRDEFGTEDYWGRVLGRAALQAGADGLWPLLTSAR